MSYTVFSKEVTRWLKDNGLPWKGTAYDSAEVTQERLTAWDVGTTHMLSQWIVDKRYKELISCAHSGWCKDSVFFEPLAEHFIDSDLFEQLRFLCERSIRFEIENMLSLIKTEQSEIGDINALCIQEVDLETYASSKCYNGIGEIAKYRKRSLDNISRFLSYLMRMNAQPEYTSMVQSLYEKVVDMNVKKSDLNNFKFKLTNDASSIKIV